MVTGGGPAESEREELFCLNDVAAESCGLCVVPFLFHFTVRREMKRETKINSSLTEVKCVTAAASGSVSESFPSLKLKICKYQM